MVPLSLLIFLSLTLVTPTIQVTSYGTSTPPLTNRGLGFGEWQHADPECTALHNMYWTHGPDGRVYHTWHPHNATTKGGKFCKFGHEHGHDPRTSESFSNSPVPFGYVNDVFARSRNSTSLARHEDHVGHKIHLKNNIRPKNLKTGKAGDSCDSMMKVHMGVYSNDAFTNNLHEVFTYVNCTAGRYVELKFLHPFGEPGRFITPDRCLNGRTPFRPDPNVLKVTPPDSPSAAGERMVPDKVCAKYLFTKHEDTGHLLEHWVMGQSIKMRAKVDGKFEYGVTFGPYFNVFNPIRFYDPDMKKGDAKHPSYIGYFSELCWSNSLRANGSRCQQLRKEYPNSPADSWKSCNSPYKGTIRRFSPNGLSVFTPRGGPHAMYTNVFFKDARLQEFPFAIKQMLGSNPDSDPMGGLSTDVVNFDSPSVCGEN